METTEIDAGQPHCGYIAIVGRPNVGKSTLINALVGEKVSIVTPKAHTTRHRTLGIINRGDAQAIFIDTPGLQRDKKRELHRLMARTVSQAIADADLILMVIDASRIVDEDRRLGRMLSEHSGQTIVVLNKIDLLHRRAELLARLQTAAQAFPFAAFVPVSARKQENLPNLLEEIVRRLPEGPALFPLGTTTDKDMRFRIAEVIRGKLLTALHREIPYGLTVEIEHIGETEEGQVLVHALIWLDRESHKPIVIGKEGKVLKAVGQSARLDLVELLGRRVHLELWVKVRAGWSDSQRELRMLGFDMS